MLSKLRKIKKGDSLQSTVLSMLLGVLAIALIGFLVFSNIKINERRTSLTNQLEDLKNQVKKLEEKKRNLEAGIYRQGSEEYIEEIARESLNLREPGEEVVAFIKEEQKEQEEPEKEGVFEKIIEKIKFW